MRAAAVSTAVGASLGLLWWVAFETAAWVVDTGMRVWGRWQDWRCGAQERTET